VDRACRPVVAVLRDSCRGLAARTCASLLAALDVHPRVAMRILRHSKIAVTMEIYTEVPDDSAREALRRLGEQLDG
jgi:integrase